MMFSFSNERYYIMKHSSDKLLSSRRDFSISNDSLFWLKLKTNNKLFFSLLFLQCDCELIFYNDYNDQNSEKKKNYDIFSLKLILIHEHLISAFSVSGKVGFGYGFGYIVILSSDDCGKSTEKLRLSHVEWVKIGNVAIDFFVVFNYLIYFIVNVHSSSYHGVIENSFFLFFLNATNEKIKGSKTDSINQQ